MPPQSATDPRRRWSFFRAGGFDQVKLESAADLAALDQLDQKLWVALSCPVAGLEIDPQTLALIDADGDSRIRAGELVAVAKWACACLKTPDLLFQPAASLPLAAINDATEEGQRILASARRILASLGKADAAEISVEDTSDTTKLFAQTPFNGDGVLTPDAAEEPQRAVIAEMIDCLGGKTDRSGKPGVDQATADLFFQQCDDYLAWWRRGAEQPDVMPLGPETIAAADALTAAGAKIDDYFARCRLAAFDPRAVLALNREEKEYLALAAKDLTIDSQEIAALPLAMIGAGRPLSLTIGLNPAWAEAIAKFRALVVLPLLREKATLTDEEWTGVRRRFAAHLAWRAAKPETAVEKLGAARLAAVAAAEVRAAINELIAKDVALEAEFKAIVLVDRLVRCRRDLLKLLNNFVSFRDFYGRVEKAAFQAGVLYLDQRACELCIRVDDVARHVSMAHLSRCYLLYCDCLRRSTGEKMTIVAAVTDGDSDNLMPGRNGVFYDRQGRDWDATVVKIIESPISIREAFWGPYKRTLRWIAEQVAKRAAAAEKTSTTKLQTSAGGAAKAAETGKADVPAKGKFDVGVVAALGVAVGGITAALGAVMQVFFGLGIWMPLGFLGLILMISGPSMVIAWLKLRERNLGPLLDANGWAVNAKVKINIPFGQALTSLAKLPRGARRDLTDRYAERHGGRRLLLVLALILLLLGGAWRWGALDRYLPAGLRHAAAPSPALSAPPPAPPQ